MRFSVRHWEILPFESLVKSMTAFVPPRRAMSVEASTGMEFSRLYEPKSSPLNNLRFRFLDVNLLLNQRVALILEEKKIRQADLVEVAGVTKGLVSQWVNGERDEMGFDAATRIGRKYGYAVKWLINGIGPKMASEQEQARGADVSETALEIARAYDNLAPICQEHVRNQINLLSHVPKGNGGRRLAAQHDAEYRHGKLQLRERPKRKKDVR